MRNGANEWSLVVNQFRCVNETELLHKFADRRMREAVIIAFCCFLAPLRGIVPLEGVVSLSMNHFQSKSNLNFALLPFFFLVQFSLYQFASFWTRFTNKLLWYIDCRMCFVNCTTAIHRPKSKLTFCNYFSFFISFPVRCLAASSMESTHTHC